MLRTCRESRGSSPSGVIPGCPAARSAVPGTSLGPQPPARSGPEGALGRLRSDLRTHGAGYAGKPLLERPGAPPPGGEAQHARHEDLVVPAPDPQ